MSELGRFLVTTESRRFAEFCDECRDYRYIGLCYGPPGVGKTLSARHYTDWDRFETIPSPWLADDATLALFAAANAVLYTPEIVNSPGRVQHDITRLCSTIRALRGEPERRAQDATLTAEKRAEDQRRFEELLVVDWMRPPPPAPEPKPVPPPAARQPPLAPVRLVLVDEADRLRVSSLEQLRDLFDRNPIGLVLIGMPGMEKRLARYPQLYSRVGFVHAFRALRADEIRQLLTAHCREMGLDLPADGVSDPDCVAAIIRITAGNFRLIHRLLAQVERILRVNGLSTVTPAVVDAAREGLVIGSA
jgi:hypothetical protein